MHTTCAFSRKSCSARQTRILSKVMKTRMKCAKSRNVLPRNGRQQAWKAVCHVYFYDVKRVSGVNGIVCMHTTVPSPKSAATSPSGAGNITLGGMYEKMV